MARPASLDQCRSSFYCASFHKEDARIERVLASIESAVDRPLTYYFHRSGRPKEIPGDRTAFVSQWLPRPTDKFRSQLLCSKSMSQLLLVSVDNVLTLHELIGRRDEPFSGAVTIDFAPKGPFAEPLADQFARLVSTAECFHAEMRSNPFAHQSRFTRQRLAERLAHVAQVRAQKPVEGELEHKILMDAAEWYVYDLEEKPITGVTPGGDTFNIRLQWLNYWSDATAARLGFPDATLDGPLQGLYERSGEGWLVKMTPQPTDLDKPEDLERVRWAYDRFAVR
jgi:Family of unknown function (DUF5953)